MATLETVRDTTALVRLPDPDATDPVAKPLRLTVLVPAHDESATIAATLESLWAQERPPERVVVVADNCTDDTADVARRGGADVFTTVGNSGKKAGALNQALAERFAHVDGRDVVMIMDADSVIVPRFELASGGRNTLSFFQDRHART